MTNVKEKVTNYLYMRETAQCWSQDGTYPCNDKTCDECFADQILQIKVKGITLEKLLELLEKGLYVLDPDQSLPEVPWPSGEVLDDLLRKGYRRAQQDMKGFKKVKEMRSERTTRGI